MTSDEVDKIANAESKECFVWLRGYIDGMQSRDANYFDVSAVEREISHWLERWRSLRDRP